MTRTENPGRARVTSSFRPSETPAQGGRDVPNLDPSILLRSEQINGALSAIALTVPAGWSGPPLHHHAFDEAFYVLEGQLTFQFGDELVTAGSNTLVFAPGDTVHTLANLDAIQARYVLEGELTFQLGDAVVTRGVGELALAPRGAHHTGGQPQQRAGARADRLHPRRLRALLRSHGRAAGRHRTARLGAATRAAHHCGWPADPPRQRLLMTVAARALTANPREDGHRR